MHLRSQMTLLHGVRISKEAHCHLQTTKASRVNTVESQDILCEEAGWVCISPQDANRGSMETSYLVSDDCRKQWLGLVQICPEQAILYSSRFSDRPPLAGVFLLGVFSETDCIITCTPRSRKTRLEDLCLIVLR